MAEQPNRKLDQADVAELALDGAWYLKASCPHIKQAFMIGKIHRLNERMKRQDISIEELRMAIGGSSNIKRYEHTFSISTVSEVVAVRGQCPPDSLLGRFAAALRCKTHHLFPDEELHVRLCVILSLTQQFGTRRTQDLLTDIRRYSQYCADCWFGRLGRSDGLLSRAVVNESRRRFETNVSIAEFEDSVSLVAEEFGTVITTWNMK